MSTPASQHMRHLAAWCLSPTSLRRHCRLVHVPLTYGLCDELESQKDGDDSSLLTLIIHNTHRSRAGHAGREGGATAAFFSVTAH